MDSSMTRRDFIKVSAGTMACISLGSLTFSCGTTSAAQTAGYPIDSTVSTTLQRTIKYTTISPAQIAATNLKNIASYDTYGYGAWSYGAALVSEKRNDLMATAYTYPADSSASKVLVRFFAITDIHIIDKESPSQVIYLEMLMGKETSTYSPTMLYTTQVLDAAIQTVNALHKQTPIDFGISLGDASNSTQYNELRWYIDVIDGKVITPSSGAHAGANKIDYQKQFKAAGLNPAIPWYQAIGNHDHFCIGSIPLDAGGLRDSYTSSEVVAMANTLAYPNDIYNTGNHQLYYMGVIDGSTPNGDVVKAGKVGDFATPPTVVPDPDRRSLTKPEWVNEFFKTSTAPVGHGFNLVPPGQEKGFACYSFVPKATVPLKVIVLDDTQREDDGSTGIHGRGFLDSARWKWLKAELAAGDAAGQLMIIAAHIPIGVEVKNSFMEWFDNSANPSSMQNAVDLPGLLAELHSHPNLLMWMAGHRHVNAVKAFASDDAAKPERGFWQVETSSLHDFPQQLRMFEIKLNSDYSISIVATNVDPAVKAGTPAATARKYAVAAMQIVNAPDIVQTSAPLINPADQSVIGTDPSIRPMPTGSYNAELFVQLSAEMKTKMQTLFPSL
ncbi:TIGR03768 family metallophosphoesterase [Oryzomonas japonica]|uniref:TIGR03768 family metallophosphoesterase n=2 Tax=Oryzomonas japonica TaxID=2603858 RepID=A0A7J4ZMI3_9BACT|nr:TIGR03768 family metallophosphoesterase [Oryzomonas japonica]